MQPTRPPGLMLNRLLVEDLMAAQPPCFALGYVQEHGSISGFMALRPAQAIPAGGMIPIRRKTAPALKNINISAVVSPLS